MSTRCGRNTLFTSRTSPSVTIKHLPGFFIWNRLNLWKFIGLILNVELDTNSGISITFSMNKVNCIIKKYEC